MYPDMDGSAVGGGAAAGSIFGPLGTVGGALLGAGLGFAGDLLGLRAQRELQKKTWQREDTAVQRRVADLRAAGLSPTLAAGSAAGSSAPINVMGTFSQAGDRASAAVEGAFELAAKRIGLRKLSAEAGQSEADRQRAEAEAALAKARVPYAGALARAEWGQRYYGAGIAEQRAQIEYQNQWRAAFENELRSKYGYSYAEAERIAKDAGASLAKIQADREGAKQGAGANVAGQANMWIEVISKMLDLAGR